ncbi:3-methyladenine DNA glycosylase [Microbacterium testaceum]|uniref:3-methyladenine DNA glycosylase n=1 Tax=Microbacterium testaceum TaxID=2033 RepID=UPI002AC72F48|nr:3-methyladenine DNA glycosylase [Microbacterium testaceum]MDZ5144139.1 3-methyladenine DNA glycosylase [Microbacterium testaceum]
MTQLATHNVLTREEWTAAVEAHAARADALTADHRARARRAQKHPVEDFLFTYYSYKPAILRRWHPGAGVLLEGAGERSTWRWYRTEGAGVQVDAERFRTEKGSTYRGIVNLLRATLDRPARFGCFGLHEWAMAYRSDEVRHAVPLRLGRDGTDAVIDAHDLTCTHFDAFRFFTPEAVPLNRTPLRREDQAAREQPGCLHAGMDVYKWAVKLGPLVPGPLLLDAFELARDIRALDMQASPCDLTAWGYAPVPIETPEGKSEYVGRQRALSARAQRLRRAVLLAAESSDDTPGGADFLHSRSVL